MFGPEYFTPAGYMTDGGVLCVSCGDAEGLPVRAQFMESERSNEWPEGLQCGSCGAEIFAPDEVESEPEDDDEETLPGAVDSLVKPDEVPEARWSEVNRKFCELFRGKDA